MVKWFKSGGDREREALLLKSKVLGMEMTAFIPEILPLEVVRTLRKALYPEDKLKKALKAMKMMEEHSIWDTVPLGKVKWRIAELVMELGLYASDAVVLSTGLEVGGTLITEDHRLLGKRVVRYAEERGLMWSIWGDGLHASRLIGGLTASPPVPSRTGRRSPW